MVLTFFDTLSKSFADVPIDGGVDTDQFLQASTSLVTMFDILGSTAFGPVKSDLNGNIEKIRTRLTAHPVDSKTLEGMLEAEVAEKATTATQALLWLLRGLQFTMIALQLNQADSCQELSASFSLAYEKTLRQYHNFIVKGIFAVALKACPYRADFYAKLGSPPEKVQEELTKWLAALDVIITRIQGLYETKGYGKGM